jgi:hypothetical protein
MTKLKGADQMTEPVIAFVDPDTLKRLEDFAAKVLPNYTAEMFPFIVGKILADLTADGIEWQRR